MRKDKHDRAGSELEEDAGSVTCGALNETSMGRRSFLGRVGRWGAVLAVFGLGTETSMRAVSGRGMMPNAVAAGAPRDPRFHPFPSDDPFNMPLGVNAWYAPASDPATVEFSSRSMSMTANNGWSHPVYLPTTADPLHTFTHRRWGDCPWLSCKAESYLPEEHESCCISERLQSDATQAGFGLDGYRDGHLHVVIDNELLEIFQFGRTSADTGKAGRLVRNQLDHYCFSRYKFSNPLANTAGTRAWGGVGLAGLIRKHEVDSDNPHIPHVLAMAGRKDRQMGIGGDGDSSSPLYNISTMFPANMYDSGGYARFGDPGNFRMGMRLALDPTIATDAWIDANAPNIYVRAVAYALRDYGCIVVDQTSSSNMLYTEQGVSSSVERALMDLSWMRSHVRRVAGAGPVHNPKESDWESWRANGQGWGGGSPRVPYSPPLSSAVSPQSPGGIQVTESRRFGDTA